MFDNYNSMVIIIDVQEKLVNAACNGDICAKNNSKLVKAAQILGVPTIITEQYPKGLGATISAITNNNTYTIKVEKTNFSAYNDIIEYLNPNKKQIIITGIETHICVMQTAMDLLNAGFEVFLVNNCCSSRHIEDYNTAIELMKQYGIKIISLEIVLFEWLKSSKHTNFKEIQALIKD